MNAEYSRPSRFCKMTGAGNDFILMNTSSSDLGADPAKLALALCPRRTSIGADGLILVEPSERPDADVRVRFWNPDGGEIATCGNGTRCAARFAVLEGLAPEEMRMETLGGDIRARVSGHTVTLRYSARPTYELDFSVIGPDGMVRGHWVKIGNPHLVLPMDDLPAGAIEPICRPLRSAPELGAEGANVHLVQVVDRHRIRIRTYERGVEAETLACGSGSMSSAVALSAAGAIDPPVSVETRSGDVLTIRFERQPDGSYADIELEGPARIVYSGSIDDPSEVLGA